VLRPTTVIPGGLALAVIGIGVAYEYWSLAVPWASDAHDVSTLVAGIVRPFSQLALSLLGMLAVVAGALCLPFRRTRSGGARVVATGAFVVVIASLGLRAIPLVQRHAFARFAERSRPLVAAIERFETERGRPPADLAELVPDYLPALPRTGMARYPHYTYRTEPDSRVPFEDRWALYIWTRDRITTSVYLYLVPSRSYPASNPDPTRKQVERIGDWAHILYDD
jgi:hypothetical protein